MFQRIQEGFRGALLGALHRKHLAAPGQLWAMHTSYGQMVSFSTFYVLRGLVHFIVQA